MSSLSACFASQSAPQVCASLLFSVRLRRFGLFAVWLALHVEPKGRASVQLAEHKEAARDFTRTLLATSQDVLLLSATADADAAADTTPPDKDMKESVANTSGSLDNGVAAAGLTLQPVACETKGTGDVNEVRSFRSSDWRSNLLTAGTGRLFAWYQEVISKVESEFIDVVRHCIAEAFCAKGNDDSLGATDVELARRLVGHLTVRPYVRTGTFVASLRSVGHLFSTLLVVIESGVARIYGTDSSICVYARM